MKVQISFYSVIFSWLIPTELLVIMSKHIDNPEDKENYLKGSVSPGLIKISTIMTQSTCLHTIHDIQLKFWSHYLELFNYEVAVYVESTANKGTVKPGKVGCQTIMITLSGENTQKKWAEVGEASSSPFSAERRKFLEVNKESKTRRWGRLIGYLGNFGDRRQEERTMLELGDKVLFKCGNSQGWSRLMWTRTWRSP